MSNSTRIVTAVAPDPPTNIQALQQSSTSITVSWFAVTGDANGGSPVIQYSVYYKQTTETVFILAGNTTASTLTYTIPVTIAGVTYNIYVTATNDHGSSNSSTALAVIAADSPSIMAAPINIHATTTQITVGWTVPMNTGFSEVIGYYLYWNAGGSG